MRLLVGVFALLALVEAASGSSCTPSCTPQSAINNTQEFRDERQRVFECLFKLTDLNHDGRVDQREFEKLTAKHLDIVTRNTLVTWKTYSYFCSCTCQDSIGWDDINGTEEWCLYTHNQVKRAYDRMCK